MTAAGDTSDLRALLGTMGLDLPAELEKFPAPVSFVNETGFILWQNAASVELIGDRRGRPMTMIAADYLPRARAALKRKQLGADRLTHAGVVLVDRHGSRQHVEVVSVSLMKDEQLVGILSIVTSVTPDPQEVEPLSPRQRETLSLLSTGLTTAEIAAKLGVAPETARNHIRRMMAALGVHSRLAAVARGRELGLLDG